MARKLSDREKFGRGIESLNDLMRKAPEIAESLELAKDDAQRRFIAECVADSAEILADAVELGDAKIISLLDALSPDIQATLVYRAAEREREAAEKAATDKKTEE